MNARERVTRALNHQEPDCVPIDLGGTICSSIHRDAYIALREHLGMEVEEIKLVDYFQQLPYLDEALVERFSSDFRMIQLPAEERKPPTFSMMETTMPSSIMGQRRICLRMAGSTLTGSSSPSKKRIQKPWMFFPGLTSIPPEYLTRLRGIAHDLHSTTDFVLTGSEIPRGWHL